MLNKKNKLKRFIACCLTAVIFGTLSHVQNVSADTKTNDDLLISQSSDTTENSVELIDADSKGVLDKIDGTHQIENTKVTEKTQARMDQLAKVLLQFYGVTSVQYAMMDHGEYVLNGQAGYSNVEAKKAPTEDTLYGVASVSKMYVKFCENLESC